MPNPPIPAAGEAMPVIGTALWTPATGFNLSLIMTRALAEARALRDWQARFAASPNGVRSNFKPQKWRFLIANALQNVWTAARSLRQQRAYAAMSAIDKDWLAQVSTDCRRAA
jgi:hypothetical protein